MGWVEEKEAVRMSYCELGVGWVDGWETYRALLLLLLVELLLVDEERREEEGEETEGQAGGG